MKQHPQTAPNILLEKPRPQFNLFATTTNPTLPYLPCQANVHYRPTQGHAHDLQHALSAPAPGDAMPALTLAEAAFKRRIGAQVAIAVEHDVARVDLHAGAIGSTVGVGAESLLGREGGLVLDVGPLITMLRGGEVVVAHVVEAVFG